MPVYHREGPILGFPCHPHPPPNVLKGSGATRMGEGRRQVQHPSTCRSHCKSRREHREQSICEHHTCPGQNSSDKCSQGPSQASAEPDMCLALRLPDPGLKPQGTGDSLWRRTEEDLRGGAQDTELPCAACVHSR